MIDEKKLIDDLLHDDGINFEMEFDTSSDESILNGLREFTKKLKEGFVDLINAQPTVDAVEVVHGRWVEDTATDMIACTECGHAWNIIDNCTETFNYCPNCGAKMDGEPR